jgi:hypothetical protein
VILAASRNVEVASFFGSKPSHCLTKERLRGKVHANTESGNSFTTTRTKVCFVVNKQRSSELLREFKGVAATDDELAFVANRGGIRKQ